MAIKSLTTRLPYQLVKGNYGPFVYLALFHARLQTIELAYVDSGAVYSVFETGVADHLEIDWRSGRRLAITGVDGSASAIYLHRVGLRIADVHLTTEIGFSEHLGIGFNLLGRHSVFNQLQFCFNDRDGELTVSRL
jgi:hypothetical protein